MLKTERKTKLLSIIVEDFSEEKKTKRADSYLADLEEFPSRSQLKRWFSEGRVRRGKEALAPSSLVKPGDSLEIDVPDLKQFDLEPRALSLDIRYEDAELIVLFKPRGLNVHPGAALSDETTLVHALLHHSETLSDSSGEFRPGIVHRLDKDTEGLLVVAKNNESHQFLSEQFQSRKIDRHYWALCVGRLPPQLEIDAPIGRSKRDRKKMAVVDNGKQAKTLVECLKYFEDENCSWVKCKLFSGRTHQIRVHLAYRGHPVLNDPVYLGRKSKELKLSETQSLHMSSLKGQALVAYELGFIHPVTKKRIHFQLDKPEWLRAFLGE